MSFSMLYFSKAADAMSTDSCCISSLMSTFFMMALAEEPTREFCPAAESVWVVGMSTFSAIVTVEVDVEGKK